MKPLNKLVCCLGAAAMLLGVPHRGWSEAKPNPYTSIVDRNPFGLKPPPPPPDPTPVAPVVPPAKVVLTGITSLFGPTSKRALLEITEQEPGKPANVRKPILREGERDGAVEVLAIDLEKNLVRIKNSGQDLDLKFEDPTKMASAAPKPAAPPGFQPPAIPPPQAAVAPTVVTPGFPTDPNHANSGVTLYGAQTTAPNGVPSALGAQDGTGRIIPSRPVRTDPVSQYATMMQQQQNKQSMPPVPPIPGATDNGNPAYNPGAFPNPAATGGRR
jgi:hypothetical protein